MKWFIFNKNSFKKNEEILMLNQRKIDAVFQAYESLAGQEKIKEAIKCIKDVDRAKKITNLMELIIMKSNNSLKKEAINFVKNLLIEKEKNVPSNI